ELPEVRWTRKVENLHVTVQFLGAVAEGRIETLAGALAEELAARSPFEVELQGLGAFPDERHATSLWVGVVDPDGRLEGVATSVRRVTGRMGLVPERRAFRPHVTVGRCKRGVDVRPVLEAWRSHSFGVVSVGEVHLYESRLSSEGSTYLLRGRAPLRGAHHV
ncbi:MAG TPA: RNA 2',3'-cyclic phosphodiesterase, partial [Polyangia bacterium]